MPLVFSRCCRKKRTERSNAWAFETLCSKKGFYIFPCASFLNYVVNQDETVIFDENCNRNQYFSACATHPEVTDCDKRNKTSWIWGERFPAVSFLLLIMRKGLASTNQVDRYSLFMQKKSVTGLL